MPATSGGDYDARAWYEADTELKAAVDFLTNARMLAVGELVGKDWFMTFSDFSDYCRAKAEALADMADEHAWSMALANIARTGFFSSDRTIEQYNREIWRL